MKAIKILTVLVIEFSLFFCLIPSNNDHIIKDTFVAEKIVPLSFVNTLIIEFIQINIGTKVADIKHY